MKMTALSFGSSSPSAGMGKQLSCMVKFSTRLNCRHSWRVKEQRVLGLVTYHIKTPECEIITLDSLAEGMGIGNQLIQAVKKIAVEAGCICLTLITTNDNLESLGFYQKRGFRIRAVYPGAVERAREFKPSIPKLGNNGIPIQDEIRLEMNL